MFDVRLPQAPNPEQVGLSRRLLCFGYRQGNLDLAKETFLDTVEHRQCGVGAHADLTLKL